jgi:hypothetical protein
LLLLNEYKKIELYAPIIDLPESLMLVKVISVDVEEGVICIKVDYNKMCKLARGPRMVLITLKIEISDAEIIEYCTRQGIIICDCHNDLSRRYSCNCIYEIVMKNISDGITDIRNSMMIELEDFDNHAKLNVINLNTIAIDSSFIGELKYGVYMEWRCQARITDYIFL